MAVVSEKVRAARKKMQIARLAKKGDPDYHVFYANQPLEKVKAAQYTEVRVAQSNLRDATEDLAVAEVLGEGLVAAQEKHAIASLVFDKLSAPVTRPGARLGSTT